MPFSSDFSTFKKKMFFSLIDKFGIIFSYAFVFFGIFFFDWEPFIILVSYFIELIVVLFISAAFKFIDARKNKYKYSNQFPIMVALSIFFGSGPFLFGQYLFIIYTAQILDSNINAKDGLSLLCKPEIFWCVAFIVIVYILKVLSLKNNSVRASVIQDNVIFQILALFLTSITGMLILLVVDNAGIIVVLFSLTAVRILLEIYFNKKIVVT